MGLDEKLVVDAHASLISVKATSGSAHALSLAARRIRSQVRATDSVLLVEGMCALLLPATPFSGAQEVASRVARFLANVPCEMHVYHGTTALLILQRLREGGAVVITQTDSAEPVTPALLIRTEQSQSEKAEKPAAALPYLAFLTQYPAPHLLHLFPYELACRYQCVPIGAARNMLTLATYRWLNREVVGQLRAATHRGIFQVHCEVTMIDEVLRYWQRLQGTSGDDRAGLKKTEVCSSSR